MPLLELMKCLVLLLRNPIRYGISKAGNRESSAKMWRKHGMAQPCWVLSLLACAALGACEAGLVRSLPSISSRTESGGIVVADEPQAVLIARDILNAGGSAADGAAALGFALSVTLQSATGLGGGGLCTVLDANTGKVEILDFLPTPAVGRQTSARWQVAVPGLARGLFALHAKYGQLPWQRVVVPAENLARFGNSITRAFAQQLLSSSSALVNDPAALDTFMSPQRTLLQEGERLEQLDLAATLGRIRGRTPGDFYAGALSKTIDESSLSAGISLNANDLRKFSPSWREPQAVQSGSLTHYIGAFGADASSISIVFGNEEQIQIQNSKPSASGFVVSDANGNAVACSLTMGEPFGAGLILNGLGFLVAPSPEITQDSTPLIALISVDRSTRQATFMGASGGQGAIGALAAVSHSVLSGDITLRDSYPSRPSSAGESHAQVNAVHCEKGLKASFESCSVSSDPSGFGYGLVAFGDP